MDLMAAYHFWGGESADLKPRILDLNTSLVI
jgi:hypothetical protein